MQKEIISVFTDIVNICGGAFNYLLVFVMSYSGNTVVADEKVDFLSDLNLLTKKLQTELLQQGKLLKFANAVRKLSRIWFSNEQYDLISQQMEEYILNCGVYGSSENRIIVQQQKKGGRIKYALSKIFIPYDVIKFHYPILQKHRWLTPFMELRRWCKLIFCGHLRRTTKELRFNNKVSDAEASNMQKFLENIGL